ncbi:hypothetical protein COY18_00380, partial [Candidatus Saccharibacteria bacterium CG_4_10_14_0_2_um_filter_41_11]
KMPKIITTINEAIMPKNGAIISPKLINPSIKNLNRLSLYPPIDPDANFCVFLFHDHIIA